MQLWKGDEATRTRDPGRGGAVVGGLVGSIDGGVRHVSVAVMEGAVVKLVSETEDTVRTRFRGIKVVLGMFEGSELLGRKVFREVFDREAGKIIGHSICL